jgi:hypothetical protein
MKIVRLAAKIQCSLVALALMSVVPSRALAQDGHAHSQAQPEVSAAQANALIQTVREATERFKDVTAAEAEGYQLQFGCVSGGDFGAMGLHYVNGALVNSGVIDPAHPQIVIYEPTADGKLRLIGADFLAVASKWNARHKGQPPQLMGQLFHLFDAPNRFGLPAFYTLHVWAWKANPNGAFVNWHPNVSCQNFNPVN